MEFVVLIKWIGSFASFTLSSRKVTADETAGASHHNI
jgi:hypothetical protein